jgi:hypothetical protein
MLNSLARRLRAGLTYANVMSTLAVFMLLGGSAYAAATINGSRLKNGTVSGKKLRYNTISGRKIRPATIYGAKIRQNTLTDREVDMSRLGKIGSARLADTATNATNAGKVDSKDASQLVDRCPSGTTDLGSACAETGARSAKAAIDAAETCTRAGGYLPSIAELAGGFKADKYGLAAIELSGTWDATTATTLLSNGTLGTVATGTATAYRCFFTLRER